MLRNVGMSTSDRRTQQKDRRAKPTPLFSIYTFKGGRRIHIRRKEDRNIHYYVDLYDFPSVLAFISLIIFSVADAFFTMELISKGAKEINPIMEFCLRLGPIPFLLIKYFLTVTSLLTLLVHKNYYLLRGKLRVRTLLFCIPLLYALLIAYELLLIFS